MKGLDFFFLRFEPILPWPILGLLATLGGVALLCYTLVGAQAPILRGLVLGIVLFGLCGPSKVQEVRSPLKDTVAIVIDRSESMQLAGRAGGVDQALKRLQQGLSGYSNLEVRVTTLKDNARGTALAASLDQVFADVPNERIAGAILISDGRLSDGSDAARPYPIHQILIGAAKEHDRVLTVRGAPKQTPIGEVARVIVRVDDQTKTAALTVRVGDDAPRTLNVPTGEDITVEIPVMQPGSIPIGIEAATAPGEISTANNGAALTLTGVRDRLRVLLVTGEPYAGSRAWRNLLKSDPSVDLIQFTILRSPEEQDFTPTQDLSLIPFPTRELFLDKIDNFDLVVFDRFKRLSVLPDAYINSVTNWVEGGGAFLMLAGPSEGQNEGVQTTPLRRILPIIASGKPIEASFRPIVTPRGRQHPVSSGLVESAQKWGHWLRVQPSKATGDVLLVGAGQPLLVLGQAGQGRVAAVMSDQAWLWRRGYDGGGPFDELFRKTAHWLMKDPDLEADSLRLSSLPGQLIIERQSPTDPGAAIVSRRGQEESVALAAVDTDLWRGAVKIDSPGLFYVQSGQRSGYSVAGIGNPNEAHDLSADPSALSRFQAKTGGGTVAYVGRDGTGSLPPISRIAKDQKARGQSLALREGRVTTTLFTKSEPLVPAWVYAFMLMPLALFGWWREGRPRIRRVVAVQAEPSASQDKPQTKRSKTFNRPS
ncbi:hypothetical protein [Candidatus Phycosocius spiralis]|uniref:Membrane protein n=1 Tax=Candidatus Phycosocius spiralis TaxID=2815099 RepID=A0ABQ4PV45_9PROT|nr:hypothetical protein [Candidatus Phycosocius spiralis]GIU66892.1 membrane protein [Candidatus Phycosocius spiralis]